MHDQSLEIELETRLRICQSPLLQACSEERRRRSDGCEERPKFDRKWAEPNLTNPGSLTSQKKKAPAQSQSKERK
ncbi:hypothetical protein BRADI_2g02823v3 [Brachypodium distachyon]|uniref:Uncharacterized protein n=1 Tax=Brachypodium distachyon TaxID=15368 RepID=A0A2K2D6L3_BRADI|nr:hypothetical protein BRADI_2g02823v3 [Brachypodium distachyon]